MILQIKKLAISEEASPDNVVNLTPVTEGPEGAAVFGISNEHENFFIEDRQTYVDRGNPALEIAVLKPDSSDITQLETWVNSQTEVFVSALTVDGGYFFGDKQTGLGKVKLVANEQLSDNDLFAIKVQRQTTPGFDPNNGLHQNGFWAGENLAGIYEWGDKDGDGDADGWGISNDTGSSFTSGEQTITNDTSSSFVFVKNIYMPFEGVEYTFSFDLVTTSGTFNFHFTRIEFKDANDSIISSQQSSLDTTPERKSVTGTSPADTAYIQVQYRANASSGTISTTIADPALRVGTGTTYTKF